MTDRSPEACGMSLSTDENLICSQARCGGALAKCAPAGDHTWATMLGQSVKLQLVPIQSLSELERARLQEVAFYHLEERDLDFNISIPRETRKRRKSLRRKFDSFSKEKKERGKMKICTHNNTSSALSSPSLSQCQKHILRFWEDGLVKP
ncbi:hypothetical protein JZ751_010633 [Albula glossodonta]|uniref:Uncharacterized protein n=1 Tax=Albula glossodonta TaxID=121402 RepID=A0A8T2MMF9_9TELE|nr:hypothetical protein JZ751_010633 [Albula glossodonta]